MSRNVIEVLLRTRGDTAGVARVQQAISGLRASIPALGTATGGVTTQIESFQSSISGLGATLPTLGIAAIATGFLALAKGMADASDEVSRLRSKLRLVTDGNAQLAKVQGQIVDLARQTRTDFSSVGELYARIARSSRELGASQSDILKVTKAVSQAIQISGSTSEEASAGMIQLSQALASGVLRGDELNSVLEQMPRVAEAIAAGMGKTVGQLRELGANGKITSDIVFNSLISQAGKLEEEFNKLDPTIGQSFQQLGDELKLFGAELAETTGLASGTTAAVNGLASAVRGMTKQTKEVKTFFETLKDIFSIGKLALDNPFAAIFSSQNYLRSGSLEIQKPEETPKKPKKIVPVDIEEFHVTVQRLRDVNGDVLRDIEKDTRTSVERQSAEFTKLKTNLDFLRDEKLITPEVYNKRLNTALDELLPEFDLNEIRAKYKVVKKETTELGEFMKGVWQEVGRSIQSTLSDALYEWKLSWKSLLNIARRALADITSAIITSGIKDALKNATKSSSSGSGGASWLKAIAGFFGFAAGGGRVDRPTIVGEDGTELVLPPARVINQRQMAFAGGGGINFAPVNYFSIIERENPEQTKQELAQYIEIRTAQQQAEFVRIMQRSGYEVRG